MNEAHIPQVSFSHTSSSASNRLRVSFDSNNFARRTHQSGREHRDIAHTGTDIEDALSWPYPCLTKQSFGERSHALGLPDEAPVLGVGVAQRVNGNGMILWTLEGIDW